MTMENMDNVQSTNEPNLSNGQSANTNPDFNAGAVRKSTTQSILKAASVASGMEFDSVESLAAALARLGAAQNLQPQNIQQTSEPQRNRVTATDLQEQFQSLKQDLSKKEQMLRERELDNDIRSSMGDRFDNDLVDFALSKIKANITWEDGSYAIVNAKGQMRYGQDGNPLSIEGLVEEVAKTNPKLLKMAQGTNGSGLRPREGMFGGQDEIMPDYTQDPAAFNAWAQRNGLGKGVGLKGVKASVFNSTQTRKIV